MRLNCWLWKPHQFRHVKPASGVLLFFIFTLYFYHTLKTTMEKYKHQPIIVREHEVAELSEQDRKMKALYEKSVWWSSLGRREKIQRLLENPVYKHLNISGAKTKKKVAILVIVSSGPRRFDRRKAIRETWWTQCQPTNGVVPECLFFTDRQHHGDKYYAAIQEELALYRDLYFQPLRGGVEFGMRYLYHLVWAMTHYEFEYLLRLDDDYFLCFERLLLELPQPMEKMFHWGYVHCIEELVRPEESIILLSRDLVEYYLLQAPQSVRCHPLADQMIGVWTTDLGANNLFRHDDRLHHAPIVDHVPELRRLTSVCHKRVGIHGTYPADMKLFWERRGASGVTPYGTANERDKNIGNLKLNSEVCELVHNFNYLIFEPEWQYEPQRCIYDPIWDTRKQEVVDGVYVGRQEDSRLAKEDLKNFKARTKTENKY